MNLRRVPADLVQMQRWEFAIGQYGDVPVSGQFATDCRLDFFQRFLRRRLIKSDGDAVILRIKPDLLDRRVIRDQSGHVRPRLVVCVGGKPIRHWILVHGELFLRLHISSQRYLSFTPHFLAACYKASAKNDRSLASEDKRGLRRHAMWIL